MSAITEIQNPERVKSRFKMSEESIRDSEGGLLEMIQSEEQTKNGLRKNIHSLIVL